MCGIVGAVSGRNVVPMLIDGLKRLEYRGYDYAGVAVVPRANGSKAASIRRVRCTGRVAELEKPRGLRRFFYWLFGWNKRKAGKPA